MGEEAVGEEAVGRYAARLEHDSLLICRRFLHADYSVACSSGTNEGGNHLYEQIKASAIVFIIIWPVGAPVMLAVLLASCRQVRHVCQFTPPSGDVEAAPRRHALASGRNFSRARRRRRCRRRSPS